MRKVDKEARYDPDLNTWVKHFGNQYTIGLTDLARNFLSNLESVIVSIDEGDSAMKGEVFLVVETQKISTDFHLPMSGEVMRINEEILYYPDLIHEDCYDLGWILKIQSEEAYDWNELMKWEEYQTMVNSFFRRQ